MIYVDTSVIVAALDPEDPRRSGAREILEASGGKVVSELVIAELASVLSRHGDMLTNIRNKLGVDEPTALIAVILYILKRFNLKYVSLRGYSRTPLGHFYRPLSRAIELADRLRLRTLDLLHLAYIKALKEQGTQIHTLLTADTDFKNREKDIWEALKVSINLIE